MSYGIHPGRRRGSARRGERSYVVSVSQPDRGGCEVIYEVFARKSRGEALRHIGNVTAPDDELARVYAYQTYDEVRLLDMWIATRPHIVYVFVRIEEDIIELSIS